MAVNIVDRTALDTALTSTADAIRAKTGDTEDITFDMANGTGFESAIEAIPSGGSSLFVTYDSNGTVLEHAYLDYEVTGNTAVFSTTRAKEV